MNTIPTNTTIAKPRKFHKVSEDDFKWLQSQTEGVRTLWHEAANADPFGSGGTFKTTLKKSAFHVAKRTIEEYGGFRFERVANQRDNRKTSSWKAYNFHGSNNNNYWNGIDSSQTESNLSKEKKPIQEVKTIESAQMESNIENQSSQTEYISSQTESNSSETLSLIQSCPSLDYLDLNTIDLKLENKSEQDFSSISRSGCSELAPCTKVAGSAPAPDAKLTCEGNPEASLTDLPSSKIDSEHGLINEPGRREDDLPVQKMTDRCGSFNTISPPPKMPTSEPALESPLNLPDPWDAQSDTPPLEPTLPPLTAPDKAECSRVYLLAKQKLSEFGLLKGNGYKRLARFQEELERGRLAKLIEGVRKNMGDDVTLPPEVFLSDYLLYDPDAFEEPQVCVRKTEGLTLVPWSKL